MTGKRTLRSGLVLVSLYARKLKRTIFAQVKEDIKNGLVSKNEVAFRIGQLNKFLYHVIVEEASLDKRDLIRVSVGYRIENGKLIWDSGDVRIDVYRYDEKLSGETTKLVSNLIEEIDYMKGMDFTIVEIGKNLLDEIIYEVKDSNGESLGVIKVSEMSNGYMIIGAIKKPPRVIKTVIPNSLDLTENIPVILARGEKTDLPRVESIINGLIKEVSK